MHRTRVLQHHYNAITQKWTKTQSEIQMEDKPFAEGAFRAAYRALMSWEGVDGVSFVCKFAKDPSTPKGMYFNDVEAHEVAQLYARSFSHALGGRYTPVSYVAAFILEFVDKPGRPVCGCEQALAGTFRKYNNNVGAVCAIIPEDAAEIRARAAAAAYSSSSSSSAAAAASASAAAVAAASVLDNWDPQSTAQAFSHFSFEQSKCQLLICDIQGVDNRFTDPQIHTLSGRGFGLGNLGQTGIRAFMLRHACTDLCRACGLPPIKARDLNERVVIPNFNNLPLPLPAGAVQQHVADSLIVSGSGMGGAGGAGTLSASSSSANLATAASSNSNSGGGGGGVGIAPLHGSRRNNHGGSNGLSGATTDSPGPTSHRGVMSAAAVAAAAAQPGGSRLQPGQSGGGSGSAANSHPPSSSASARATPSASRSPSPSSSSRGGGGGGGGSGTGHNNHGSRHHSGSSPWASPPALQPKQLPLVASSIPAPAPAPVPTRPPKPVGLDDSDEALMASIMGD